ncbi:Thymocyte nuclear protein 1 [Geranomyces michiganensis]|nr:Thymocyte nuclear protein 1 [Geranomyces michiganensis]
MSSTRPKRKAAIEAAQKVASRTQESQTRNKRAKKASGDASREPRAAPSTPTKPKPKAKAKATAKTHLPAADKTTGNDNAEGSHRCSHWLIKAEPETRLERGVDVRFSIDDLEAKGASSWDGVRSYEARNIMRDRMKLGDQCFFYHSSCKVPGIAGIAEVVKEAYPDHTAFDADHPYYDPKSDADNPKWMMVDVKFVRKLRRFISLKELQGYRDSELRSMALVTRGRLSVQPVSASEWDFILGLEKQDLE